MFTDRDKKKALAIVHVFETSKPLGDYSSVAVLDDGAGISYGTSQFTHKSRSLAAVLLKFQALGGVLPEIVAENLDNFQKRTNISACSANKSLKNALKTLGSDPLMQRAQDETAFDMYLFPAIKACQGSNFTFPLSLACIYDSINQGSYERVRDKVTADASDERAWIADYVRKRIAFLRGGNSSAMRNSVYRPQFFLEQIAARNWTLELPLKVHGVTITERMISAADPAGENRGSLTENAGGQVPPAVAVGDPNSAAQPPTAVKETVVEPQGDAIKSTTTESGGRGDAVDAEPTKVTTGQKATHWGIGLGTITSIGTAVWGFMTQNASTVAVAIICVTVLILALVFRKTIIDAIRMQTAADPDKNNVT